MRVQSARPAGRLAGPLALCTAIASALLLCLWTTAASAQVLEGSTSSGLQGPHSAPSQFMGALRPEMQHSSTASFDVPAPRAGMQAARYAEGGSAPRPAAPAGPAQASAPALVEPAYWSLAGLGLGLLALPRRRQYSR